MHKFQIKNQNADFRLTKIVNIDKENHHIFRATRGISMKFSGKMCLMIILKVIKSQGITLSMKNAVLEKTQGVVQSNIQYFQG